MPHATFGVLAIIASVRVMVGGPNARQANQGRSGSIEAFS
jgi:hypothetical protein